MEKNIFVRWIALGIVVALLSGCNLFSVKLNDDMVTRFCKAYEQLKKTAPDMASAMANNQQVNDKSGDAINKIATDNGFKDFLEFMNVNTAVGAAYGQLQAEMYMKKLAQMFDIGNKEVSKALSDPNVPADTKSQLQAQMAKNKQEYDNNKKIADQMTGLLTMFADKENIEVVRRHFDEVTLAFTGMKQDIKLEFMGQTLTD